MPRPRPKEASNLENDVRSLQSKLDLVVQKLNNLEKNVHVLGKTVVAVNDRVKNISATNNQANQLGGGANAKEMESVQQEVNELKQEVSEIKHTVDLVNPLQFTTRDAVREMISDAKND